MRTKITEEFPWTRTKALQHHRIPLNRLNDYASFFPPADHGAEGSRPRWKECPLAGPLWCAVARKFPDSGVEVAPLGGNEDVHVAYTGTKPMAEQAAKQLVRQWNELPHKNPVTAFKFDADLARWRIEAEADAHKELQQKLEEVNLV